MRVNHQPANSPSANTSSVDTLGTSARAGSTQKIGQQGSPVSSNTLEATAGDHASLSGATNLVALARSATTSARQAKISALTQQVQSGSYQGSTAQAGKAMVQELLPRNASAAQL